MKQQLLKIQADGTTGSVRGTARVRLHSTETVSELAQREAHRTRFDSNHEIAASSSRNVPATLKVSFLLATPSSDKFVPSTQALAPVLS